MTTQRLTVWVEKTRGYIAQRTARSMGQHADVATRDYRSQSELTREEAAAIARVQPEDMRLLTVETATQEQITAVLASIP